MAERARPLREFDSSVGAAGVGATPPKPAPSGQVVVKKYANRRLYNTESSSYITLDNLAEMVRAGRDFVVFDAKTGEDITRSVLTQIIVEEESKGTALLPTGFLRQLIGFYGDSMQGLVPRYLEQAMSTFARQQQQMRLAMQQTMGNFFPFGIEEMGRQNMAMMERAMSLFTGPFYRPSEPGDAEKTSPETPLSVAPAQPGGADLERLYAEIETLRRQLEAARLEAQPKHDVHQHLQHDTPHAAQRDATGSVQIPDIGAPPGPGETQAEQLPENMADTP